MARPGRAKATRAIADLRTIANSGSVSVLCSAYELAHGLLLQPYGPDGLLQEIINETVKTQIKRYDLTNPATSL